MIKVLKEAKISGSILDFSVDNSSVTAIDNNYNVYIFSSTSLAIAKSLPVSNKYEPLHAFSKAVTISKKSFLMNLGFSKSKSSLVLKKDTGNAIKKVTNISKHESEIECSVFSTDETMLATGGSDGRVFIFDTKYMEPIVTLDIQDDYISSLSFSQDGAYLISSCFNQSNILFDIDKNIKVNLFMTNGVVEDAHFF